MKSKLITIITASLLFALACSFLFVKREPKECTIIINGRSIHSKNALVCNDNAILPMFEVMTTYGVSVEWLNEHDALISYKDVVFELSLSRMELIDNRRGNDWFLPLPGSKYFSCDYIDGEILLDDNTLHNILFQLGIKTEITINYRKGEVSINSRTLESQTQPLARGDV